MTTMSTVIRLQDWRRSRRTGSPADRGAAPAPDDLRPPLEDEGSEDRWLAARMTPDADSAEAAPLGSVTSMAGRRGRTWATGDKGIDRLDRAVGRLQAVVTAVLEKQGRVAPRVETELLAIMGEVTVGLLGEAAARAERLTESLVRAAGRP
jgi:hypothetical protein